jgi:flagellar basal body P-ring protein FlgI
MASTQWALGPRDLITILQAIKAAGAIQADIEVM